MKKICLILCTSFAALTQINAQGLSQWFSQKSSELQYYAQQIAAYHVYLDWLENGYMIAKKGLGLIGEIKNGEFNLHQVFFSSLLAVNPAVSSYAKIKDIFSWEADMLNNLRKTGKLAQMSVPELDYIHRVSGQALANGLETLEMLLSVLNDGQFRMSDDQRIAEIDRLWNESRDGWTFSQHFLNQALLLSLARTRELNETSTLQKLY